MSRLPMNEKAMVVYLKAKIEEENWRAVSEAAVELREEAAFGEGFSLADGSKWDNATIMFIGDAPKGYDSWEEWQAGGEYGNVQISAT